MKIARFANEAGHEFWAVLEGEKAHVLRGAFADWSLALAQGAFDTRLKERTADARGLRLLAPVDRSARVFGVGLNYLTHLTHLGRTEAPPHPISYLKPQSAVVGPDEPIAYPPATVQLDYEVELVAVMARPLDDNSPASSCLLGYTVGNDVSARDAGKLLNRLDLFTQKALDRTAPIGPHIVTLDDLGGAGQPSLDISLTVNGELRQQDNTRNMIFGIDELLNYVDARVALRPGDLVFTGTTFGVGLEDGRFLQPGDVVEARIEGIGALRNTVAPPRQLPPARRAGRLGLPNAG